MDFMMRTKLKRVRLKAEATLHEDLTLKDPKVNAIIQESSVSII